MCCVASMASHDANRARLLPYLIMGRKTCKIVISNLATTQYNRNHLMPDRLRKGKEFVPISQEPAKPENSQTASSFVMHQYKGKNAMEKKKPGLLRSNSSKS